MDNFFFNLILAAWSWMVQPVQIVILIVASLTIVGSVTYALVRWDTKRKSNHFMTLKKIKKYRTEMEKVNKNKVAGRK
ncbi:hypothetical protein BH11BAC5_BH11BAC5_20480 [soil metagenome]